MSKSIQLDLLETIDSIDEQTNEPNHESKCSRGDGVYPDLTNECKDFYQCLDSGSSNEKVFNFACPESTRFDSSIGICNHENLVSCS
jgi:hypothetical protein